MRQLTSLDVQFLALENARNYGHVSGLMILDPSTAPGGRVTLASTLELFEARLHLLPPFRWRLVEVPFGLDHPYWIEDPGFDLEYHVRELGLPAPGDDRQLAEQVARLHARPLDRARPLWETYLIHGLEGDRVAVLTKIHHAAVDGMSGAEILTILLDLAAEGREIPARKGRRREEHEPGQLEMLLRGLVGMPRQQLRAVQAVRRALPNLDQTPTLRALPGAHQLASLARRVPGLAGPRNQDGGLLEVTRLKAPRTVFNGKMSGHRRVAFGSLSLSEVKAVKNHFGVTVNDVVVALCTGALRSWLEEHDELPADPLLAMIPVSVRTPEQSGTFGNRVSAMIVALATNEPDPATRLRQVHEVLRSAKELHRAVPASLMQDAAEFIPPALLARAARVSLDLSTRAGRPAFNVTISNVPGSPFPLYSGGARLLAQFPMSAIADGAGLNITVLSYLDQLDFGIVTDRVQVPDAWPLMDGLRRELA